MSYRPHPNPDADFPHGERPVWLSYEVEPDPAPPHGLERPIIDLEDALYFVETDELPSFDSQTAWYVDPDNPGNRVSLEGFANGPGGRHSVVTVHNVERVEISRGTVKRGSHEATVYSLRALLTGGEGCRIVLFGVEDQPMVVEP